MVKHENGRGHTPGPWVAHQRPNEPIEYGHHVTTADGLTVCSVTYQLPESVDGKVVEARRIANARLIAAAPELLACAERSSAALRSAGVEPNADSDNPLEWLLHETLAAISKARGEA